MEARLGAALEANRFVPAPSVAETAAVAKQVPMARVTVAAPKAGQVDVVEQTDDVGAGGASNSNPDDTNVWPTAAEEASFLSEARGRGEVVVPVPREVVEEADDSKQPLPKLDDLVNRIPAETRELLDELFRAKFVAVRRVKKTDLKG